MSDLKPMAERTTATTLAEMRVVHDHMCPCLDPAAQRSRCAFADALAALERAEAARDDARAAYELRLSISNDYRTEIMRLREEVAGRDAELAGMRDGQTALVAENARLREQLNTGVEDDQLVLKSTWERACAERDTIRAKHEALLYQYNACHAEKDELRDQLATAIAERDEAREMPGEAHRAALETQQAEIVRLTGEVKELREGDRIQKAALETAVRMHDATQARLRHAELAQGKLREALEKIAKGEGRFSRDNYEFACNVIEEAKQTAHDALATPAPALSARMEEVVKAAMEYMAANTHLWMLNEPAAQITLAQSEAISRMNAADERLRSALADYRRGGGG